VQKELLPEIKKKIKLNAIRPLPSLANGEDI